MNDINEVRIRLDTIYLSVAFLVLAMSLIILDKGLFVVSDFTGKDAFHSQIMPFMGDIEFADLQVLQYMHFIRFLVVSPLLLGEIYNLGGIYFAAILALFAYPILAAITSGKKSHLKYIILLIPIFVSFRTFLAAAAIAYLFIAIYHHKSNLLLFLSLLISTLSSGVVLVWFIICLINYKALVVKYRYFTYILFVMMLLAFIPSLVNKYEFANEVLGGYTDYLMRGTLVESIVKGWWSRVIIYSICLIAMVTIVARAYLKSGYRVFYLSYSPFFLGAMFEGLGFICGLIVLIMFLSGFRPNDYTAFSLRKSGAY